jgi:excisionase family DNA binding protein
VQGKLAYSVAELTELTTLSRDALYDAMRRGELKFIKVGARRIITADAWQAFVAKLEAVAA